MGVYCNPKHADVLNEGNRIGMKSLFSRQSFTGVYIGLQFKKSQAAMPSPDTCSRWDGRSWMHQYWEEVRNKNITQIVLPGSHHSASSTLSEDAANDREGAAIVRWRLLLGKSCVDHVAGKWSKCQKLDILQQLESGVRYLDLRVGWDASKFLPEHKLRACYGFFSQDIGSILQQVTDFCLNNTSEFVILDLKKLYFKVSQIYVTTPLREAQNLHLVKVIEERLGSLLVPSRLWHQTLSNIRPTGSRIFVFYPVRPDTTAWLRPWMIPGSYVDSMWPPLSESSFLKSRVQSFIKTQEGKRQQIIESSTAPKQESLFVMQGIVSKKSCHMVRGSILASVSYFSQGCLNFDTQLSSIEAHASIVNPMLLKLLKNTYNPAFLNIILLDWVDNTVLTREIIKLNL